MAVAGADLDAVVPSADASPGTLRTAMDAGCAFLVDASGCDPERLRSRDTLVAVFAACVRELGLHRVAPPVWHAFPGPGGWTGFLVLGESHLACHTFPERGFAAFDLYCCRPLGPWPWAERLRDALGATRVTVREVPRGEAAR